MYVAVGQFAVTPDWEENAQKCVALMLRRGRRGVAAGAPGSAAGA
jgi:hypothetical protein